MKTGTKKGAAKKAAAAAINAAHKQHGGALKEVIKAVKLDIVKKSKKGGGRAVGAGRKIGAGAKKKPVPLVVAMKAELKEAKGKKSLAVLELPKGKKGSGRAVGAGRKRKKQKKRGGMHQMDRGRREAMLRGNL